jgi:hypothetical protein
MTDATPTVAERIVAILSRPPRDWLGASAIAEALQLPHRDALAEDCGKPEWLTWFMEGLPSHMRGDYW